MHVVFCSCDDAVTDGIAKEGSFWSGQIPACNTSRQRQNWFKELINKRLQLSNDYPRLNLKMFSLRFLIVTGTSNRILRFHNIMSYSMGMAPSHLKRCCILLFFFSRSAKGVATILTTLNPLLLNWLGLINWLKKILDIAEVNGIHRLSDWCWNKTQLWGWRRRSTKTVSTFLKKRLKTSNGRHFAKCSFVLRW